MDLQIQKARRNMVAFKAALTGVSGGGKTLSALRLTRGLVGPEGKILVIDTENGSAALYADEHDFDILRFPPEGIEKETRQFGHDPRNYIAVFEALRASDYDAIIWDSASHEWIGEGGVLAKVDQLTKASKSKNSYTAGWGVMSGLHRDLMQLIVSYPKHIIATFRAKHEYVMDDKNRPAKVGMGLYTREDVAFEFSLVLECLNQGTNLFGVDKTRISQLRGRTFEPITESLGQEIAAWMETAEAAKEQEALRDAVREKSGEKDEPEQAPANGLIDLVNELMKSSKYKNKREIEARMAELGLEYSPEKHHEILEALQ